MSTAPTLEQVLLNTLNNDERVRREAEKALHEACAHPDYVVSLLRISCEENNPKEIRQAASVALKNAIKRNWTTPEEEERRAREGKGKTALSGQFVIPLESRNIVRANILQGFALVRSNNESVRRVLAECVGLIVENDFPERWPTFIQEIMAMLSNVNDRDCVHNALLALRRVVKFYEYKRRPRKAKSEAERKIRARLGESTSEINKREPLNALVEATFPILLEYAANFVAMDDDSAAVMLRLIGKIFYSATRLELPPHLANLAITEKWFKLWETVIRKSLSPAQSEGDDIDDLSLRPWWKCKKAALEIGVRVFNECSKDPMFISDDDNVSQAFTRFFIDGGVATALLEAVWGLLEAWAVHGRALPSRILQLCLSYVAISLEPAKTYKLVKPHLQFLLDSVVLRCLSFSEKDAQEWLDEPEAYAAHDLSPLEDVMDVKATAAALLLDACRLRTKDVLDMFVSLLTTELAKRSSASKQDGCLFAVGTLAEILAPYPAKGADGEIVERKVSKRAMKYQEHLESLIGRYVMPELNAPEPHVRSRACWVVGRYAHVQWKDVQLAQRTFGGLLDRLGDEHLPVQSQAASSLKNVLILDPEDNLGAKALRTIAVNHLPLIVQKYLHIMSKVGSEDVVGGLQALIDAFQDEIAPMAVEICMALTQAFFHYANADEEDDEDGSKAQAAYETLDAIQSLMECAAHCPDKSIIARMEGAILPVLQANINPEGDDVGFLEPTMTMFQFLTYYAPLTPVVWSFVGRIYQCFNSGSFDMLAEFAMPLEHLAFRDPQRFFAETDAFVPGGQTYAMGAFELCRKVLEEGSADEAAGEQDVRSACALLCALLQAAPNENLVPFVESACRLASHWLFIQKHTDLANSSRARLFEVIESCLYIAPVRTRAVFGNNLLFGLTKLRESLGHHLLLKKKKVAVLGLSRLISVLPSTDAPEKEAMDAMALAVAECTELLENIKAQKAFNESKLDGEDDDEQDEDIEAEGDEEEDYDESYEYDEDENAEDEDQEAYRAFLKANGDWGGAFGMLEDDDEEEEEDPEDYPWPLNPIDEAVFFAEAVKMSCNTNVALVRAAIAQLDPSVRNALAQNLPQEVVTALA